MPRATHVSRTRPGVVQARTMALATVVAAAIACGGPSAPAAPPSFDAYVDRWLDEFARMQPSIAAGNGLHAYDGTLEDFSAGGIAAQIETWKSLRTALQAIPVDGLTPDQRVDHRILGGLIDAWLLDLETARSWRTNLMVYASAVSSGVHNLMTMESAPAAVRAERIVAKLRGVPSLLAAADANLVDPPRVMTERGLRMIRGAAGMLRDDVPLAFAGLDDETMKKSLLAATAATATALDEFATRFETTRLPSADGAYAVGRETLEARYRAEELIDLSAPQLLAIGERELDRAETAFTAAAAALDPGRPAQDVWRGILKDHPARGQLVAAAQRAVDALQAFVVEKRLATIPAADPVVVAAAPPYDLGLASMHSSPPLEATPVKSYFYITDAQASWDAARQDAWLERFNVASLAITTAHEVMPGHYLHSLFMRNTPGKVRRIWIGLNPFPQPSSGQDGWAHYAEQLVVDEGFMDGDPRYRMGQLSEAMTRICRLISGIRLHTGEWTVDQAAAFFEARAHLPAPAARQEAERGTYDPTYGGYFLGKMAALKLREDVRAKEGAAFELRRFHERVMTNGIAPWWAHRQLLLPGDASPVLQ
ncbi:MAG: DUF885 domain-containing protein [Vicinamibacterales bacterium]